ncbi:hypothetical protein FRB99_000411 [Tulasnella sp. 403]|nr:hypothetical protein FRB99_000411 [Tulasnella sp. 403]
MDFIVKLLRSRGLDSIWVVVDRLTKEAHFIPTIETVTAPDLTFLFLHYIFRYHGTPESIISDHGSVFISKFMQQLVALLQIKMKTSTSYHPQTDGQTEWVNQVLEQYLRCFCSYQQDDWVDFLLLAEFAYNNAKSSSTQISPFFAARGYYPTFTPVFTHPPSVPAAADFTKSLESIHAELIAELHHAQQDYAKYYDRKVLPPPVFEAGDHIWLLRHNIKTRRPSDKLDHCRLSPFLIARRQGPVTYRLDLPPTLSRLHPVFHMNLLEKYHPPNDIPGRSCPAPPPVHLDEATHEEWYEVDKILDARKTG